MDTQRDPPQPRTRDRTNENFEKARENIMWRCDEISRRYQADVYIVLRLKHKHYEYSSIDAPSWPLSKADMERVYPVPIQRTPASFIRRRSRLTKAQPDPMRSTSSAGEEKV
ncbi:hypothetical protein LX32DRAFT_643562 [Colletotrichum zoysiae]|uniref:MADS-box domain-containing protein n=1 Tax=Colletotrichum zoysiae TaxID=1216348 RepID=A0AAD9HAG9_9PEZI|nr:hypothetical protein LX32DRAFT_643562 [Colletotrichum zoysiae]